ncbi:unnamed protein product [Moneuplotes crassus]|uniref:Uncharacterized protein n=1 Tax=Euplotes crassus TaxID=5936 RepID=A0AAD1UJ52_EUPCR|nr:unnamed protein product [Moneuplotes crassus]
MSKHNHNPIPQDSETINDMFNKGQNPHSKAMTIEPKLREGRDYQSTANKDLKHDMSKNSYNDYHQNVMKKPGSSVSKKSRTSSLNFKRSLNAQSRSILNKDKKNLIKEGLEDIDHEMHYIDENIPEDALEEDEELDGLINSNKLLREKVHHISDIVLSAVEKATSLRKQIITHRNQPDDEELKSKLKEINKYQKAIMKIKYPRKKEDYKEKEIRDQMKILTQEIQELEEKQIQFFKKQNNTKNRAYEELVRGNQEKNLRVVTLKSSLQQEKEIVTQLEQECKQSEAEYNVGMKQLMTINSQCRAVVEKRMALKNGKVKPDESEVAKEDRMIADIQKKKIIKRIAKNKLTQFKMKVKAQKDKNRDIDKEIMEIKEAIQEKIEKNEQMSKRVKELKGMFMQRPNDTTISNTRAPPSPDHTGKL